MNDRSPEVISTLGRRGRLSAAESDQFDSAARSLPGGTLANHSTRFAWRAPSPGRTRSSNSRGRITAGTTTPHCRLRRANPRNRRNPIAPAFHAPCKI